MKHAARNRDSTSEIIRPGPLSSLGERQIFLFAMVCLVVGMLLGYMIRGLSSPATAASAPPPAAKSVSTVQPGPVSTAQFDEVIAPLEAALKSNPKNLSVLVQLGNIYSDHRVFPKAIVYYTRALDIDPKNVKVRTDLGSVYWYSGYPDKALREYQQSLSIDPRHYQTLFNLGIVYESGFNDYDRAIATWEKLLQIYPQNPNREQVAQLIQSARKKAAASRPQ